MRGILDGIDGMRWNPRHDSALPASYDAHDLSGKAVCKAELQGYRPVNEGRRPAVHQLACLRYGTVPILSPASGLTDTVIDYDVHTRTGSGIICDDDTERGLVAAVRRAARVYASSAMSALVERAMAFDLTWNTTARRYANLYREIIAARA